MDTELLSQIVGNSVNRQRLLAYYASLRKLRTMQLQMQQLATRAVEQQAARAPARQGATVDRQA